MIDKTRAVEIASGWGSYMNSWDPGICMYGLSTTGKVQSPEHRADLITYVKDHCIARVAERDAETAADDEEHVMQNRVDREELDELLEYINAAPLEEVSGAR